jgi:cell division protein FtsB
LKSPLMKLLSVIAVLAAFGFAFSSLRGPQGIPAWLEKRSELRRLEEENAALAREIQAKRERIQRLRQSQTEQEMEIRQRLKLVRPDEKVFILDDPPRPASPPAGAVP